VIAGRLRAAPLFHVSARVARTVGSRTALKGHCTGWAACFCADESLLSATLYSKCSQEKNNKQKRRKEARNRMAAVRTRVYVCVYV
jgi:hypothetical protein